MKQNEIYDSQTRYIKQDLRTNEKNLLEVAQRIARVKEEELYKIGNYKNINDYCLKEFNLDRRRVHECLKVVYRFCEKIKYYNSYSTSYCVKSFFKEYDYTKLVLMHDMTEDEIIKLGIVPNMSCKEVKKIINNYKKELLGDVKFDIQQEDKNQEDLKPEEYYNLKYALMVFDMDNTYIRDKGRKINTLHGVNYLRDLVLSDPENNYIVLKVPKNRLTENGLY